MLKRKLCIGIIILILPLFLCCCTGQSETTPTVTENNISASNEIVISEDTINTNPTLDYEQWKNQIAAPLDGEGMIPLLFVNAQADAGRAYLICAGNNGEVYLADQFTYDGKPLYNAEGYGRLEDQDRPSTTKILDQDKTLQFVDPLGATFFTKIDSLSTTGRIYDSFVIAQARLNQNMPVDGKFYLGTYKEDGMFPKNAVYSNNGITVDLDNNGATEQISWVLTQKEYVEDQFFNYSGYFYDYSLTINQNGTSYTISSSTEFDLVGEGDFQVFLADVDQDHIYEIVVYKKICLRFDDICIYDYDGTSYVKTLVYTITPMS